MFAIRKFPNVFVCLWIAVNNWLSFSWWVLASLTILGRQHWIDNEKLKEFILNCQDTETGGFSDRPGNMPDIFHTLFGTGALSLLGYPDLKKINPTLCMPDEIVQKICKVQILD